MRPSPLQNRVQPDGAIVATAQRGLYYGNRGGKIHDPTSKTLHPTRRWASRQWICCVLQFKQRRRPLMGPGYTELFFMDEVTALAAGHRPCFECRRADALRFAHAWRADGSRETAPEMDRILQQQRVAGRQKRTEARNWHSLPAGAMILWHDRFIAKHPSGPLQWSFDGYDEVENLQELMQQPALECLTPGAILTTLANGYEPDWHPSASNGQNNHAQI